MSSFSLDVQAYNHKHYETNTYGILGKRGCGGCIWETVVALHLSEKNNCPSPAVRALASAIGDEAENATFTEAHNRWFAEHLRRCSGPPAHGVVELFTRFFARERNKNLG